MATDLSEILTDLTAHATTSSRIDTTVAADARIALSRLRPALNRLHDNGLDTGISTSADPDAFTRQAERVHWVRLLANTCARLGDATPATETPGPMTRLADAAAVTAVLHADVLTGGQRWAIVAGLARTANHLVTAAGGGDQQSPDVDRALIIADASSGVLFQFAALDPPAAGDYAALHYPVPDPSAQPNSAKAAVLEASAALAHATRPGTGPHSIADILAIASAATTACQFVVTAYPGVDGVTAMARDAARAWVDVREQLTPFNDGSRRRQTARPPAVDHALTLHRLLRPSPPSQPAASPRPADIGGDGHCDQPACNGRAASQHRHRWLRCTRSAHGLRRRPAVPGVSPSTVPGRTSGGGADYRQHGGRRAGCIGTTPRTGQRHSSRQRCHSRSDGGRRWPWAFRAYPLAPRPPPYRRRQSLRRF